MHSNYMMIKMGLWEDKGINNLYELLTVIGISLSDAKQLFKFMPRDQQAKLENKIFSCAEKFNLLDVAYLSFMRHTDYSSAYMASDFYYMLTAALEHPPKIRLPLE